MMAVSSPFLPLADSDCRLLRIHKGSKKEDLSCSLETHDVEAGVHSYTAISYAWGPPEAPHFQCYVDGFPFSIRHNAHSILRQLQHDDEDVLVWLDALCINQRDKTEKSAQIRLMYRIYQGAHRTAIWLGEADDSTESVLNYANTLDVVKLLDEVKNAASRDRRAKVFLLDELASHSEITTLVNGIGRIFRATWFSRVWIRQEGAVGGHPYALRGPYAFTWAQLTALAFLCLPRDSLAWPDWVEFEYYEIEPSLSTVLSIQKHRSWPVRKGLRDGMRVNKSLLADLVGARASLTEKPHDKVYALSTMVSNSDRKWHEIFLKPDYDISWQELYVRTAKFFFSRYDENYVLLSHAGLIHQGLNSELPSWVPDWRYVPQVYLVGRDEWCAGGGSGRVKARVLDLSKQERQQLLANKGFASITSLCGMPKKHIQKQADNQMLFENTNSTTEDARVREEDLRKQEKWSRTQKSTSKAASLLEISVSLQDRITYVSPNAIWISEDELMASREAIIRYDQQNLEFLASLEKDEYITSESLVSAYNKTLICSLDPRDAHILGDTNTSANDWRNWLKGGDLTNSPPFEIAIEHSWAFRYNSFAWTENSYMALLPCSTQPGDHIVVFPGHQMPFVIRPVQEYYMLIGPCYVHGMMRGDASLLIEEFDIKFANGKTNIKRPQGDVRANGKKHDAGRYVEILMTLGERNVKLI